MNSLANEVAAIIGRVRKDGDRALEYYQRKFDGIDLQARRFEVPRKRLKEAYRSIRSDVRSALDLSARRIGSFHRKELSKVRRQWCMDSDGVRVGQRSYPLESAGIYVPGGRFCYPSTVLMTAIPAKAAGVGTVVMVTPAKNMKDEVMAAAYVAKVDRVFAVGGPAAIAALAFGTKTVPRVDKIVGPGNRFVTEAKRQVYGAVGIDGLAGPSEVAIWADGSADPVEAAANMMAQAEHDPDSRAYLFCSSAALRDRVKARVEKKFWAQTQFIVSASRAKIVREINDLAPEHLILAIRNPGAAVGQVRTAGAIFIGGGTPVPLGDYSAGPSHVLPTGRAGRFGSGLSAKDFLRWSSTIESYRGRGNKTFGAAKILAETEGLAYHAKALERR